MISNMLLVPLALLAAQATSITPQNTVTNRSVDPATTNLPRCVAIAPGNPQYEPLRKVCDFALKVKLPDFICDETVFRFTSNTKRSKWKRVDVVTAELTYENGLNERYSNVAINGRRLKVPATLGSNELAEYLNSFSRGTWAAGPFGGDLAWIFWPSSRAKFELQAESGGSPAPALVFDFQIDKTNSPFSLNAGAVDKRRVFRVGAEGSIWIDKATSRLIRVQIRDTQIDRSSEVTVASVVIDYGETPIGNLGLVLVPLASAFLACDAHSCGRNVMGFQNWRKFASEVHIILEK